MFLVANAKKIIGIFKCSFAQFRAFEKIVFSTKTDVENSDKTFNNAFLLLNDNKLLYKVLMNKALCDAV